MKTQKTNTEQQTPALSEVLPDIGDEIRKVLVRKHLSGAWLAVRIGCDRTNIYKILRKKSIDTSLLLRISVVLDHDFFGLYSREFKHSAGDSAGSAGLEENAR